MGCTPNSVPMVFIGVFYGFLGIMTHKYPLYRAYIGISNRGTVVGVHPIIPWRTADHVAVYTNVHAQQSRIIKDRI